MKEVVLLLTGCIKPNVADAGVVLNPQIRKRQYLDSINWYLSNTPYKIVFCENSGYDISSDIDVVFKERIEFLTYKSNKDNRNRSKGYKEMEILEHIQNHSESIKNADVLVKITGRLQLLNICNILVLLSFILNLLPPPMKKFGWVSSYKLGKKPSSDCKYIFFSKEFLHYLIDEKENIYNHYNFERITGDAVMKSRKDGLLFVFPPLPPREHGISGGHGTSYDISAITYFKETIKNSIRFVLFALKILPRC